MDQTQIKHQIDERLATLATLRDEIRVKLHLVGMDAKKMFEELEHEAERVTREVSAASHQAIEKLGERFTQLANQVRKESGKATPKA